MLAALLTAAALAGPTERDEWDACAKSGVYTELPAEGRAAGQGGQPLVAVVVAAECYRDPELPRLVYTGADGRTIATRLHALGFTVIHRIGEIDGENVDSAIRAGAALLASDGTFVFYFSGHGSVSRASGRAERYLLTSRVARANASTDGLKLISLQERIAEIPARRHIGIVDACQAGTGHLDAKGGGDGPADGRNGGADLWLYASDWFQAAGESAELGGSDYTRFLGDGLSSGQDLDGDGRISLLEAHFYAWSATYSHTRETQTPAFSYGSRFDPQEDGDARPQMAVLFAHQIPAGLRVDVDGIPWTSPNPVLPVSRPLSKGRHRIMLCSVNADGDCDRIRLDAAITLNAGDWYNADPLIQETISRRDGGQPGSIRVSAGVGSLVGDIPVVLGAETAFPVFEVWYLHEDLEGGRPALGASLAWMAAPDAAGSQQWIHAGLSAGWWWQFPPAWRGPHVTTLGGPTAGVRWVGRWRTLSEGREPTYSGAVGVLGVRAAFSLAAGPVWLRRWSLVAHPEVAVFGTADEDGTVTPQSGWMLQAGIGSTFSR